MDRASNDRSTNGHGGLITVAAMGMIVVGLAAGRAVAHALVAGTFHALAPATEMFLETLTLALLLGLATLLLIVVMAHRRPHQQLVRDATSHSVEASPPAVRHLTLVRTASTFSRPDAIGPETNQARPLR